MSELELSHCPLQTTVLPTGWALTPIQAFVEEIQAGFASGKHNSDGDGIQHLRPMNISPRGEIDLSDGRFVAGDNPLRLRQGDVLFNNTNSPAWVGKTALIETDEELAFSNHMTRLRMPKAINSAFVAKQLHFLCRSGYFLHQCKKHVNQASINRGFLAQSTPFLLPPEAEQRRIVSKIESLQTRSSRARVAISEIGPLLEQFRQSVLQAAFSGRLTADWRAANPDIEPATELLSRIRTERRHSWEQSELNKYEAKDKKPPKNWHEKYKEPEPANDSGLPVLPDGWCWARWEEVGFCQNGRAFPSKHYAESGVKLIRPGNLHVSGEVVWNESNSRFMPDEWEADYPTYIVGANELVMNLTAQSLKDEFLGRVCLTGPDEHCLLNQRIARITPLAPLLPEFCLLLFKSPIFRRYVDKLNMGSLIQHMFTTQVFDFVFPLPPVAEHHAIIKSVRTALEVKDEIERPVVELKSTLTQLDQSILAKAFRGELVPNEAELAAAEGRDYESAGVLLTRIREALAEQKLQAKQKRKTEGSNKLQLNEKVEVTVKRPILNVLKESSKDLTPEELFRQAGCELGDVDDFYVQLRAGVASGKIIQMPTVPDPANPTVLLKIKKG